MRGMQSAHSICALPPRKMPLQSQQAVLLFLQDSLLQAGDAAEDKGCYEVGGAEKIFTHPVFAFRHVFQMIRYKRKLKKEAKAKSNV